MEVAHRAATLPMTATVDAELVGGAAVALHVVLEVFDVDVVEQRLGEVGEGVVALREPWVDVTH